MTSLLGLVLAGGRSSRMQSDKAALAFGDQPQLARAFQLIAARVAQAFVSVRPDQQAERLRAGFPQIVDGAQGAGPVAGILAAQQRRPDAAWLVIACDLPLLDAATLDQLLAGRDPRCLATAFRSASDGLPEPLCAIYEPASGLALQRAVAAGRDCPRKFLVANGQAVRLLDAAHPRALANANTPQDLQAARAALESA